MNKFAEIVKTNKSKIVKGAVVIGGSAAGLVIGLGMLDDLRKPDTDIDVEIDTVVIDETSDSPRLTDEKLECVMIHVL